MASRVWKHIAWPLWLQNLPETLEPHLAEIKHQPESNLQHPDPLAHGRLPYNTLQWESLRAANATSAAAVGSKPASKAFNW
jgi:hypothetical protein